uniref:Uncharacterized protein n=1 Tax=Rhizophora mucronata TaxID=61149 RepID=A0A2P2MRT8_RHIMU
MILPVRSILTRWIAKIKFLILMYYLLGQKLPPLAHFPL